MPIYEYHCKSCEKDVEVLQRTFNEKVKCPECGSNKMSRLLSVISKGRVASDGAGEPCESTRGCGMPQCGMRGCGLQ